MRPAHVNILLFIYQRARRLSGRLAALIMLATFTTSCFITEGLTSGKGPAPRSNPPAQPQPAAAPPAEPEPPPLAAPKLARRLALDLLNRFPADADITALTAQPNAFSALVDAYLASAEASRAVADLHPRMWRFKASLLPDLEGFIAAGDTTLGAALTSSVRNEILREPALALRLILDRNEPFARLFTANYAVMHPDVAALYGLSAAGNPWPGEPYVFTSYDDGRPDAGILAGNGTLAAFDTKGDPAVATRSARLLTTFGCFRTEAAYAHRFYELDASALSGDLRAHAATKAPCIGCHAQFHDAASAFQGLGSGDSFADWLAYQPPSNEPTGRLAATPFTGLAALGAVIGDDSRTHRCELERLAIEVYQRRAGSRDQNTLADALTYLQAAGGRLKPAMRQLLTANEYKYAPVPPTLKTSSAQESSGVRILKRNQWLGILRQLSYSAGALEIPEGLEPGAGELATDLDHVPAGTYFHYADRLARQAATAIVNDELRPGATAATRRVLTALPDGTGEAASPEQVKATIRAVWALVTTETLDDTNQIYLDLQALWTGAEAKGTADDFKRAWRVMLVAILTHPNFLIY